MTVISASIMPLAALFFTPLPARSSLCALEALRWVVGGATMTTPGGTRTPCQSVLATSRARRTGFYHGSELPTLLGSGHLHGSSGTWISEDLEGHSNSRGQGYADVHG